MADSFKSQFSDSRWLRRQNALLEAANYQCVECGSSHGVQIHFCYWDKESQIWEYPDHAFRCLCSTHLDLRKPIEKSLREALAYFTTLEVETLLTALEVFAKIEIGRSAAIAKVYPLAKHELQHAPRAN